PSSTLFPYTTLFRSSVLERTREFGVISALGLPPRRLGTLVTYEALLACAVGWGVGLVLGYGVAWLLASYNLLGPLFAAVGEGFRSEEHTSELQSREN